MTEKEKFEAWAKKRWPMERYGYDILSPSPKRPAEYLYAPASNAWAAWLERATEAEKQRHGLMECVRLILRLARRVRVLAASDEMPTKAVEFLQKHDLMGSPFRLKETEK